MKAKARGKPKTKATTNAYWWFSGATVTELTQRLNAAGEGARLEVRIDAKKSMTLDVVATTDLAASKLQPLNDSHLCPPICPK
jgi:hypothetical protein